MSDLTPITREEALLDGADLEPITRKEQFIKRIYDKTQEVPTPVTREEYFLKKAGEGTSPVAIEQLNVTENGTYSETGKAYSPVIVEVPLPTNANERKTATSYPVTDSADYPLPKCEVTVTNADKCEVIVTSDNTITENNAPYLYRATPSGNKELNELVGGTVAWNQNCDSDNPRLIDPSFCSYNSTTHEFTINYPQGSSSSSQVIAVAYESFIANHKYFGLIKKKSVSDDFRLRIYPPWLDASQILYSTDYDFFNSGIVFAFASENNNFLAFSKQSTYTNAQSLTFTVQFVDLTQMFGTTIADYIYSLEQATAGSGIAWLKSYGFLTEDYYPYNAGELMSVKTSARKVYDSDSNFLANYPLSNIELRGVPKLVNNQLVYDGDRYEGNGRVTRKYGIVDLGTLEWTYSGAYALFWSSRSDILVSTNMISSGYAIINEPAKISTWGSYPDKSIGVITNVDPLRIGVKNSAYTDAATFKTAMNGVYLVYELVTSTTEQTSPYDNPQLAGSTEEFVDTREVAIPVGHESKYFNGEGYITYLDSNTSDTIDMAQEHAIMPLETTYISANGTLDVEYWKSNS